MENEEKARVMKHHYSSLNQDAPFMLRATGKFEWLKGYSEPDEATLEEWKTDMLSGVDLASKANDAQNWLDANDWQYNQHQRRVSRETITPEQEVEFKAFLDESDKKAQLIQN